MHRRVVATWLAFIVAVLFSLPASGEQPVRVVSGNIPAYAYVVDYFTPYATPTDVVGIVGSATKLVKIQKIYLSGTQTTAGINKWYLIKRSTADTGGTPSAITAVKLNSLNATAGATVQKYTAAPTTGTLVGNVRVVSALAPAPASVSPGDICIFDGTLACQPIELRGVAEELDLNFAGAAVPAGLSIGVTIVTTEE